MPNSVRTRDQLYVQFPDNITRLIKAVDGRDLIASVFGYSAGGAPNASCDKVDTLGLGAWFDAGSIWINTAAGRPYFCISGNALAAVWRGLMFLGDAAGGDLAGTYPDPTIKPTGATAGTYGGATTYASFTINAAGQITSATNYALPSGGVTSVNVAGPAGTTATGGPVTGSGVITITWDAITPGQVFGKSAGTGSGAPGFFALDPLDIPNLPAAIITSGTFGTGQIPNLPASIITSGTFGTAQIPNLPASIITSGVFSNSSLFSLDASIITSGMFSTSQIPNLSAAFITSGLFTNAALFSLNASIITSGNLAAARLPVGVPIKGNIGAFSQWFEFDGPYTLFNAAGTSNTVTVLTLPGKGVVKSILWWTDTAYTGGGTFPSLAVGYSSGQWTPFASTTQYGSALGISAASTQPPNVLTTHDDCRNLSGGWNVTATVSTGVGNLSGLTAGRFHIWVEVGLMG